MVVSCEHVWREVSNYLDHELDAGLRAAIEDHLRSCKHCTAVVDGTRNVITLYGDDRLFILPKGFSERLERRISEETQPVSGNWSAWMMSAAAAAVLAIGFMVGDLVRPPDLRTPHSQPAVSVPAEMMVAVNTAGKTFHKPDCPYLHEEKNGQVKLIAAAEAMREGYSPCARCMREYLRR
jgi:predicted anti-sigma-YlaC factor YlaD